MKKQINPTTKAHLIRGAFYLLLLLAICAIPFALARPGIRGTAKPNTAALLSYVDNQCGDCKELFSSGSTPLNGVLRDMFRYLST